MIQLVKRDLLVHGHQARIVCFETTFCGKVMIKYKSKLDKVTHHSTVFGHAPPQGQLLNFERFFSNP